MSNRLFKEEGFCPSSLKFSIDCTKLELFIDKIYPVFAGKINFELIKMIDNFRGKAA